MKLFKIINMLSISLLIASVVLVVCGYIIQKKIRQHLIHQTGVLGEMRVATILRNFARKSFHEFYVMNDVYLPLYDKTTQIDHLLIGRFGVLVIESKHMAGHIYGSPEKRNWAKRVGGKSISFYNPLMQNKGHINCLLYLLRKEGINDVFVQSLVVFSHPYARIHLPKGSPVITISLLHKYLKKRRYTKNNHVDAAHVYEVIKAGAVSDRKRIRAHTGHVKKMAQSKKQIKK